MTTARDLVESVVKLLKLPDSAADLSVFEVVADGQLERVLHYSDVVLGITLSWSVNWPPDDAKTNYLIVKHNKQLFEKLTPYLQLPSQVSGWWLRFCITIAQQVENGASLFSQSV